MNDVCPPETGVESPSYPLVAAFGLVCGLTLSEHRFRIGIQPESSTAVTDDTATISPGPRFRAALVLAIIADCALRRRKS